MLFLVYPLVQRPTKQPPVQAQPGCIVMIQSTGIFGRISYLGFDRDVRTWEYGALFLYDFVFGIVFLSVRVLLVGAQCLVRRWLRVLQQCLKFWTGCTIFKLCCLWDANPEVFGLSFSRRMERSAQSMLRFQSWLRCSHQQNLKILSRILRG